MARHRIEEGDILKLSPQSKNGRRMIDQHGNKFKVLSVSDSVRCFDDQPGFFLESERSGTKCWIRQSRDSDFFWRRYGSSE